MGKFTAAERLEQLARRRGLVLCWAWDDAGRRRASVSAETVLEFLTVLRLAQRVPGVTVSDNHVMYPRFYADVYFTLAD